MDAETMLTEAARIVAERRVAYGDPGASMAAIAALPVENPEVWVDQEEV